MKDKQSKKVVIIEDIRSDTIEQAIFILRNHGGVVSEGSRGQRVIEEAQRVINAYVDTVEKAQSRLQTREKRARKPRREKRHGVTVGIMTFSFLGVSALLFYMGLKWIFGI